MKEEKCGARHNYTRLVRHLGIEISSSLWHNQTYDYSKLDGIDPKLAFRVPRGPSRNRRRCLHRLHLHVPYTNQSFHLIGMKDSPVCKSCHVIDTVSHALCCCIPDTTAKDLCIQPDLELMETRSRRQPPYWPPEHDPPPLKQLQDLSLNCSLKSIY